MNTCSLPSGRGGNRCVLVMPCLRCKGTLERLQYTNSVLGFLVFLTRSGESSILALAPPPVPLLSSPDGLALQCTLTTTAATCLTQHRARHLLSTPSLHLYSKPIVALLSRLKILCFEPAHPRDKKFHEVGFEHPVYWGVVTEGQQFRGVAARSPALPHLTTCINKYKGQ